LAGLAATPIVTASAEHSLAQPAGPRWTPQQTQAALKDAKGTKLVLLGTAAGPVPGRSREMTSHVMLSNGAAYVLDCGMGVTNQYARTGIPFQALKSIFITHHHADHNIEYGPLLIVGWIQGLHLDIHAYGPPPLNRLALHPDAFAMVPRGLRRPVARRILRAGGSPWVRQQVEGRVTVTEGVAVERVERIAGGVRLELSDGSAREVAAVIVSAGFRFALDRLAFLAPEVRAGVAVDGDGFPVLDRWFRSSEADLLFVGYPAERRFGPIARFVSGSRFTARRAAEALGT